MSKGRVISSWSGKIQVGDSTADKIGFYGKAPASRSAAYTITNRTDDRAFDCNGTGEAEVRDLIGTIIYDLQQLGIFQ